MILSFKTIDGDTVDVAAETVQLVDRGERAHPDCKGMEARYHVLVGDAGWCHALSKEEYDRLHRRFAKARTE